MDVFLAAAQACDCSDGGSISRTLAALVLGFWLVGSAYWALVCGWVAREKDRNVRVWAAFGFLIWLFAFLPIAAVPDLSEYETD